jgi:DNA-binding transcriptional LysR family regulator
LDVALFTREGRRLRLAPAGEQLLPYARQLLTLAEEAHRAVRDNTPRGPLVLGAMDSTAAVRLPTPLSYFVQRYPEVQFTLKSGNPDQLAAGVLAGKLHAALIPRPLAQGPFEFERMFSEELVIVARKDQPPMGRRGQPLPSSVVAFEKGCPHRARLEAWYEAHDCLPSRTVVITSYHSMLGCVSAGMGVALLPRSVLATFAQPEAFSVHTLPAGQRRLEIALVWRRGTLSPNLRALIAALNESTRPM